MHTNDFHWLCGLLEGEGSFLKGPPSSKNRPRISVQTTDEDVAERIADLLGVRAITYRLDKRNANWKRAFCVVMRGNRAVVLMRRLRPLMGSRRCSQIDAALASYQGRKSGDNTRKLTAANVRSIRRSSASLTVLARRFGV